MGHRPTPFLRFVERERPAADGGTFRVLQQWHSKLGADFDLPYLDRTGEWRDVPFIPLARKDPDDH